MAEDDLSPPASPLSDEEIHDRLSSLLKEIGTSLSLRRLYKELQEVNEQLASEVGRLRQAEGDVVVLEDVARILHAGGRISSEYEHQRLRIYHIDLPRFGRYSGKDLRALVAQVVKELGTDGGTDGR